MQAPLTDRRTTKPEGYCRGSGVGVGLPPDITDELPHLVLSAWHDAGAIVRKFVEFNIALDIKVSDAQVGTIPKMRSYSAFVSLTHASNSPTVAVHETGGLLQLVVGMAAAPASARIAILATHSS